MADVHVSPVRTYAGILLALLVLTAITVWVGFKELGALNDVVALGVAITKATLVVLFFMHVKYAGKLVKVVVIAAFFWLLIIFGLTILDYATRSDMMPDPEPVEGPLVLETGAR
jgi:cytochrome c oxidase subunit 4